MMCGITYIFKADPGPVIGMEIFSFHLWSWHFLTLNSFWLFLPTPQMRRLDNIPENTSHFKVASLHPCDKSSNCSLGALNFSFLTLELTVGLSFFLQEVSSCPPFFWQTVNWQASSIWQDVIQQQSSSTALTARSTCQRIFLPSLSAVSEQCSTLRELLQSPWRWIFPACSSVSFLFD